MAKVEQYEITAGWMNIRVSGLQEALNTLIQLRKVGDARITLDSNPLDISHMGVF